MRYRKWTIAALGVMGLVIGVGLAQERLQGEEDSSTPKLFRRTIDYFSRSGRSSSYNTTSTSQESSSEKERVEPSPSRQPTADVPWPSRFVRNAPQNQPSAPAQLHGVKNYHKELFASENPSQKTQVSTSHQAGRAELPPTGLSHGASPSPSRLLDVNPSPLAQGADPAPARLPAELATATSPVAAETANATDKAVPQVVHADHQHAQNASSDGVIQPVSAEKDQSLPWPTPPASKATNAGVSGETSPPLLPEFADAEPPAKPTVSAGPYVSAVSVPNVRNYSSEAPVVKLQWLKQSPITVGRPCRVDLIVSNSGKAAAENLAVYAFFPATIRLAGVKPQPLEGPDHLSWQFASLSPGEQQTIQIEMIPSARGELDITASAQFVGSSSALFKVEEPLLTMEMKGPTEVQLGDPASQIVTVSNPGTGVAEHVVLEAQIPKGLDHPRGDHIMMELGSLNPGESRTVRLSLAAIDGGEKTLELRARADAGLTQSVIGTINVIAPSLKVTAEGPALRYAGRKARYTMTIVNDGGAASNNVRIEHRVPAGFVFVQADEGGSFDRDNSVVRWFIGRMEPGQSRKISVELEATQLGDFAHTIVATSEQGAVSEAHVQTKVDGTASLLLEVVDFDDPVETGRETAYEVRVTNDGTKAAQNIGLSCELPSGVELIAAKGATDHVVESNAVIFQTLPQLGPNKTALFRIQVRGTTEGNHRIRARLASDSIQEPLVVDELTKFYAD